MQQLKNTTKNSRESVVTIKGIRDFTKAVRILEHELSFSSKTGSSCCGITLSQSHLLVEIYENPGESLSYFTEQLRVDKSALSRTADCLIKSGLIKRVENAKDRRNIKLYLTGSGRDKVSNIFSACDVYYKKFFEASGSLKIKKLLSEVKELSEKLSEYNKTNKGCCSELYD